MHTISFDCEVITPMFLAGADGKTPEIREPSIKGALRFWWRALHGHLMINDTKMPNGEVHKGLKSLENEIFGGGGDNACRSALIIKTTHAEWDGSYSSYLLPHKSMGLTKAFNPDTPQHFEISLFLTRSVRGFDMDKFKSLFVLACLLGGVGKRSRRGCGSVKIVGIKERDETDFKPFDMPMTLNVILEEYINCFSSHYKLDNPSSPSAICLNPSPLFKEAYPYIKGIQIGSKLYCDYGKFLYDIGKQTHDSRVNYPNDQSLGDAWGQERFASPVYVSALKDLSGSYRAIITTLNMAAKNSFPVNSIKQNAFKNAIL